MSDAERRARRKARRIAWSVRVGGLVLRALASTWRIRQENREPSQALRDAGHPVIYTLWHGEMLPLLWNQRGEGITVLVSEHGDGEIIARVLESHGFRTVRGSTSRGASRALLGMSRVLESGGDIAFTPDGPRGPAHSFAPGALIIAQRSGASIVPLRAVARSCWRLRSWDGFMIPKPFARITIAFGDPIRVEGASPREAAEQADRFAALMRQAGESAEAGAAGA
jgi:lysophospholipid acyltransferase (LPLAT)-like uncharacterized protein